MIELPDGKVCRNLPEQVGENTKNINKIIEYLNGIDIKSNLVVVADMSQILTSSELDIVEKPVAFLYYDNQLYIKKNEVGGSAFFDVIFSISGSTVISFTSKEIEVNLSTGALSLTTSTVYTYSKSEIDNSLSSKADLSGAEFTGAVKALTFEQTSYNSSLSFNFPALTPTQGELFNVYNKLVEINNVVYVICSIRIENNTGSSITFNSWPQQTITITNPKWRDKIVDVNGNKISDTLSEAALIAGEQAVYGKGTSPSVNAVAYQDQKVVLLLMNQPIANQMTVKFVIEQDQTITINDGQRLYISARIPLLVL